MVGVLLAVSILVFGVSLASNSFAEEKRKPVKLEGKKILPLRVLARPFSNVYKEQDAAKGTVMENVPAFQSYYAYSQPKPEDIEVGAAWYEVGTDNRGTVIGWMKADDVFEWKQTMCLAYTHPEGRKPVLMFERGKSVKDLVEVSGDERTKKAGELYAALDAGNLPDDFPVISVEPKKAVDISEQFYLLPILDFQTVEVEGREGRLVRLAAVTGAGPDAREKTDIRKNKDYLKEATGGATQISKEDLSKLAIDVVWVMDTTVSMRPYLAKTLDVVKNVSSQITQDKELAQSIRFGIWGYRDPVDEIPGIGYNTKNYTPELQTIDQFSNTMAGVDVTKVDSVDYEEELFSGMDDAINKTQWTPGAIRFIVLVGDAPGHELGHKWNLSGQDENTLRSIADDKPISVMALQIKAPKAKRFHEPAEIQFMGLSRNKGLGGESTYLDVASNDLEGFARVTSELAAKLNTVLYKAKQGIVAGKPSEAPASETTAASAPASQPKGEMAFLEEAETTSESGKLMDSMINAALVEWIGSQTKAKAPRDIVAWALDKDMMEPAIQAMEVRLLINKRQLDSLKTVLSEVMSAGRRGQIGGEDFFDALQATAATAARDPNQIKNAKSMAKTGLIPEFLVGLPYKSRLMDMSNELWGSWSVDEQDEFLNELDARIQAYVAIHDAPEGWIQLNKGDDADESVYPISLDLLP